MKSICRRMLSAVLLLAVVVGLLAVAYESALAVQSGAAGTTVGNPDPDPTTTGPTPLPEGLTNTDARTATDFRFTFKVYHNDIGTPSGVTAYHLETWDPITIPAGTITQTPITAVGLSGIPYTVGVTVDVTGLSIPTGGMIQFAMPVTMSNGNSLELTDVRFTYPTGPITVSAAPDWSFRYADLAVPVGPHGTTYTFANEDATRTITLSSIAFHWSDVLTPRGTPCSSTPFFTSPGGVLAPGATMSVPLTVPARGSQSFIYATGTMTYTGTGGGSPVRFTNVHQEAVTTPVTPALNKCLASKNKCVSKKMQGLLKCHVSAEKDGIAVDGTCIGKARAKFDGNRLVPPAPAKGCFAKAEAKNDGPCITANDTNAFEAKVDAFVDDVVHQLDPGYPTPILNACSSGKKKCVLKKAAALLKCYEKAAKDGAAVDAFCLQKAKDKFDGGTKPTKGCFAKLEAKGGCITSSDSGALEDTVDNFVEDVLTELHGPAKPLNSRRCTGDTRKGCVTTSDCSGVGGTCEFWFGSNLPLSAGGVDTCVTNQFNGGISGTANVDTGSSAGIASVTSRVYGGQGPGFPCPRCEGDVAPNDGVRGGTCNSGSHSGLTCDSNGVSGNRIFGETSLDCPPSTSVLAALPIDLTNTTGTKTKTLSAASPNCRAVGHTGQKCFCDTCDNLAATPCSTNADCGGGVCGGKRCLGAGGNAGSPCTVNGDCTSNSCGVPGLATAPNQCDDDTCTPSSGNEGSCAAGPVDSFCGPTARFVPCITNADCSAFPGDTCSIQKPRDCYTDNGVSGASVSAQGVADPPFNHQSNSTLASLFCIGPTASAAVNAATGLPGLGRLALRGHSIENGTPCACPSRINFDPDTGGAGVLDAGWTGNGHDSSVISKGLVTVAVTGCASPPPTCGVCNYVGPIPNPGAASVP